MEICMHALRSPPTAFWILMKSWQYWTCPAQFSPVFFRERRRTCVCVSQRFLAADLTCACRSQNPWCRHKLHLIDAMRKDWKLPSSHASSTWLVLRVDGGKEIRASTQDRRAANSPVCVPSFTIPAWITRKLPRNKATPFGSSPSFWLPKPLPLKYLK
jgi:hypothetical protein